MHHLATSFSTRNAQQFFIDHLKESLFLTESALITWDITRRDWLTGAAKQLLLQADYYKSGYSSQAKSTGDAQTIYAWNSWYYHGERAGDLYFMHLVEKLCRCDKMSWVKAFSGHCCHPCVDGLNDGITWLQVSDSFCVNNEWELIMHDSPAGEKASTMFLYLNSYRLDQNSMT